MYNEHFGFKESPFSIAPDPRYLYMTTQHREALAHLIYGLNSEGGCILLTGEVGTGKTTICRCLLEQIPEQANVALVLNPKVNEIELLETICDELKIDYPDTNNSVKTYTDRIYNFLIENNRKNESTVLIIDEAQNLDSTVLEQLRLLTNLETDQRKLLQIIILGQPELLDILAKTEMRQLAQRITARYHLEPLSKENLAAYIDHRLAVAGQNIKIFPEKSIQLLYKLSKGIPRLINVICDRALLGAYVENQYTVSPRILKKAAKEVFGELKNAEHRHKDKPWLVPAAIIGGIAALSTLLYFNFKQPIQNFSKNLVATSSISIITDKADNTNTTTQATVEKNTNPDAITLTTSEAIKTEANNELHDGKQAASVSPSQLRPDKSSPPQANETNDIAAFEASLSSTNNSLTMSYDKLFTLWGESYNKKSSLTGCKQAEKVSLHCLHKTGNLNTLKELDRPALLKLISPKGNHRYITIAKIHNNIATIYSDSIAFSIPTNILDQYWHGQFILLWKKPDEYTRPIKAGERSVMTGWLHSLFKNENETLTSDLYNNALSTKVRTFQTENQLTADGIVGPATIIHLNARAYANIPTLTD